MTNLQAIQVNISDAHGVVLSENHFVKALLDVDLDPYTVYTSASKTKINQATLTLYDVILGGANLSEGSLSYNVNIESVKAAREALLISLGTVKNTINSVNWW